MHRLLVLYPQPSDPEHFRSYYESTHLPLVAKLHRPARLPLQRRHRRRRGRVAVSLRVRGGLRRCGGLRGGDGTPRRSGSACGRPELRYRRRRRAELRTPRANTRKLKSITEAKAKTDRLDARTLAKLLID